MLAFFCLHFIGVLFLGGEAEVSNIVEGLEIVSSIAALVTIITRTINQLLGGKFNDLSIE